MANIDEELSLARQALAAIENRPKDTFAILRKAAFMTRQAFSSEAKLNEARRNVSNALGTLIRAFERRWETSESIGKAKDAVEAWIKELEAAKP